MSGVDINIEGIGELIEEFHTMRSEVADLHKKIIPRQTWWTLKQACRLKCGTEQDSDGNIREAFYGTVRHSAEYQPNGGIPDAIFAGRRRWRWETIERWLNQAEPIFSEVKKLA